MIACQRIKVMGAVMALSVILVSNYLKSATFSGAHVREPKIS